ncbi:type VI secretion system tube protein Hcp [[Empedobacter] haloabium]|uniref:Type VI secretion system tube protein Hcp n=1 Tax=[Empedobacter] haloabium TaxID=592317 RepID=A0ABZ1UQN1_9BURK
MSADLYLRIDTVAGESADRDHQGWIEVDHVYFGVAQPKSATASSAGGHTAERCEMADITFSKLSDMSTPLLLQLCAAGRTVPRAKFEFVRADGGQPVKYFEIELENVLIAHVSPSVSTGSILGESVGLKFSKVRWRYSRQKIGGGSAGNTTGGWDLSMNRIVP